MIAKGIYLIIHVSNLIIGRLLKLDLTIVDMNFVDIGIYNKNPKASSSFVVFDEVSQYSNLILFFSLRTR